MVTQGHGLALTAVTEGVTQGHAPRNGTGHPLKGGRARERDPQPNGSATDAETQAWAERLLADHADINAETNT